MCISNTKQRLRDELEAFRQELKNLRPQIAQLTQEIENIKRMSNTTQVPTPASTPGGKPNETPTATPNQEQPPTVNPSGAATGQPPPVTPPQPGHSSADGQQTAISAIGEEIKKITQTLSEVTEQSARKDEIIKSLHAELQMYKNDLRMEMTFPLLKKIITWEGRVADLHKHYATETSKEGADRGGLLEKLLKEYENLSLGLRDLLDEHGLVPVEPRTGDSYDAKIHKLVDSHPTADSQQDRVIIECKRAGFADVKTGRIFKLAEVIISKFQSNR